MARVHCIFEPQDGERETVHDILGADADWRSDGATGHDAEALLSFAPRREIRNAGTTWDDYPRLRLVKLLTAGANHVGWRDWPPHLLVAATPGATGPSIAEYILAALLGWARGMWHHTQEIRAGRFHQGAPVRSLSSLRVGLVGYGGIGRATARLLAPMGVSLRAVNQSGQAPDEDQALLQWLGTRKDLQRLVQESDAIVLCLPCTRHTIGLVDLDLLSGMTGRNALLINVSRGPVVDEQALHAWLDSDTNRHAAVLDVWWDYPRGGEGHPFTEPFHRLPNLIMTPHNSPNIEGYRLAMVAAACHDLKAYLDTGEARHVQDPEDYTDGVGPHGT